MFLLAAKAGFGVVVVLVMWGIVQANAVTDAVLALLVAGMIPGTTIEIPADFTLLVAAIALIYITNHLSKRYAADRALLQYFMSKSQQDREDPPYDALIPGLRRMILASRSLRFAVSDATAEFQFWLKHFGRPVVGQMITASKQLTGLVRFDRWAAINAMYRENMRALASLLHEWLDKARAYFVRLMF